MMRMKDIVVPSAQILELMTSEQCTDTLTEVVRNVLSVEFYRAIETGVIMDRAEAEAVESVCEEGGVRRTEWASPIQNAEHLVPGSLDQETRREACSRLKELMLIAGGNGAEAFAFLSGPAPRDMSLLSDCIQAFSESFAEIAEEVHRSYPQMDLLLEPLDRYVHKHGLIGPTRTAAEVLAEVRKIHPNTYMAWDSAHVCLNHEDLVTSLRIAGSTVGQLHLCNAVLDEKDVLYGDYHISPGERGYLTVLRAADTITEAAKLPLQNGFLPVAIEARPQNGETWKRVESESRKFLGKALKIATSAGKDY